MKATHAHLYVCVYIDVKLNLFCWTTAQYCTVQHLRQHISISIQQTIKVKKLGNQQNILEIYSSIRVIYKSTHTHTHNPTTPLPMVAKIDFTVVEPNGWQWRDFILNVCHFHFIFRLSFSYVCQCCIPFSNYPSHLIKVILSYAHFSLILTQLITIYECNSMFLFLVSLIEFRIGKSNFNDNANCIKQLCIIRVVQNTVHCHAIDGDGLGAPLKWCHIQQPFLLNSTVLISRHNRSILSWKLWIRFTKLIVMNYFHFVYWFFTLIMFCKTVTRLCRKLRLF